MVLDDVLGPIDRPTVFLLGRCSLDVSGSSLCASTVACLGATEDGCRAENGARLDLCNVSIVNLIKADEPPSCDEDTEWERNVGVRLVHTDSFSLLSVIASGYSFGFFVRQPRRLQQHYPTIDAKGTFTCCAALKCRKNGFTVDGATVSLSRCRAAAKEACVFVFHEAAVLISDCIGEDHLMGARFGVEVRGSHVVCSRVDVQGALRHGFICYGYGSRLIADHCSAVSDAPDASGFAAEEDAVVDASDCRAVCTDARNAFVVSDQAVMHITRCVPDGDVRRLRATMSCLGGAHVCVGLVALCAVAVGLVSGLWGVNIFAQVV